MTYAINTRASKCASTMFFRAVLAHQFLKELFCNTKEDIDPYVVSLFETCLGQFYESALTDVFNELGSEDLDVNFKLAAIEFSNASYPDIKTSLVLNVSYPENLRREINDQSNADAVMDVVKEFMLFWSHHLCKKLAEWLDLSGLWLQCHIDMMLDGLNADGSVSIQDFDIITTSMGDVTESLTLTNTFPDLDLEEEVKTVLSGIKLNFLESISDTIEEVILQYRQASRDTEDEEVIKFILQVAVNTLFIALRMAYEFNDQLCFEFSALSVHGQRHYFNSLRSVYAQKDLLITEENRIRLQIYPMKVKDSPSTTFTRYISDADLFLKNGCSIFESLLEVKFSNTFPPVSVTIDTDVGIKETKCESQSSSTAH